MYEAKVVRDSICDGYRLTTMQLTHPRIVHSEFNTHCMFARNASSSRAIPVAKQLERVMDAPFIPEHWGMNQKGMQSRYELKSEDRKQAIECWLKARDQAVHIARILSEPNGLNVHKQIVNRLIEPFSWITVCVTGDWTAWSNYFALRCHEDADPALAAQAYRAQYAYFTSKPKVLKVGDWHTPYIKPDEERSFGETQKVKISIARCARTSYLTQEGSCDPHKDLTLFDRLVERQPLHASPLEHVAIATHKKERVGKYTGWVAYRHCGTLPGPEYNTNFEPNHPSLVQRNSVNG
jgi:hypothetical protein